MGCCIISTHILWPFFLVMYLVVLEFKDWFVVLKAKVSAKCHVFSEWKDV